MKKTKLECPDYIIYTDGGCAVNPGGPGGCAAVIIDTSTGEIIEKSEGYVSTTNNRMEMMAMILAFQDLPDRCSVEFCSDSQYLIKTLAGEFRKKKNVDLWKKIDALTKGKEVSLNWVRGHNGVPENERCDAMCLEAMNDPNKKDDTGYAERKNMQKEFYEQVDRFIEVEEPKATSKEICIPEEFQGERIELLPIQEYCKKYNVNNTCAAAIRNFEMSRKRFKDYIGLKTGGMDFWSRKKQEELCDILATDRGFTEEKVDLMCYIITKHLSSEKTRISCLKWYLRGLPLYHCIRREQVAEEVAENCR